MRVAPALLACLSAALIAGCAPKPAAEPPQPESTPPSADVSDPPKAPTAQPIATAQRPALRAEDLVEIEALPSDRFVRAGKSGEIAVRLHLRAKTRKVERRTPINLALVVDTSGSMEGASIEHARAASLALLDALSEGDRLALVVFHSRAETLVHSTVLTQKSIADIRARIGEMKASGTTDLAGGLSAGLAEARQGFQANGINRLVVLGDGVPNDPAQIPALAQSAGQQRIAITMLGLGLDYDETLMGQIALASGGKYHYLRDSSQVAAVFSEEVLRLKQIAGRGTMLTLTPGPGVVVKDVLGLPVERAGARASVRLGDLSEGDQRDVVVRLSVTGRHAGSVVELLDADVAMDNLDVQGQRVSEHVFVSTRSSEDAAEIAQGKNRDVKRVVARLSVADAIVRAIAAARSGDMRGARALLDGAEKEARDGAKELEDTELAEKVKDFAPLRKSLAALAPPPPPPIDCRLGHVTQPMPAAAVPPAHARVVMKSHAAAMDAFQ